MAEYEGAWQEGSNPPVPSASGASFRGPSMPASDSVDESSRLIAAAALSVLMPAMETAIVRLSGNASALVNSTLESLPEVSRGTTLRWCRLSR